MKKGLLITGIIIALTFGFIQMRIYLFPVHVVNKSIDTAYDIVDKTMNAENAIYNYEWFKQQEADIRKCLTNEEIAQEEYNNYLNTLPKNSNEWSKFQEQEESSLRNSLSALKKTTNKAIEDYNAKTSMANRNIFNDNLPSNITRAFYAGFELIK